MLWRNYLRLLRTEVLLYALFQAVEIADLFLQNLVDQQIKDILEVHHVTADDAVAHALY